MGDEGYITPNSPEWELYQLQQRKTQLINEIEEHLRHVKTKRRAIYEIEGRIDTIRGSQRKKSSCIA